MPNLTNNVERLVSVRSYEDGHNYTRTEIANQVGVPRPEIVRWYEQRECPALRRMILVCAEHLGITQASELLVAERRCSEIVVYGRFAALLKERRPDQSRNSSTRELGIDRATLYRWLNDKSHHRCYDVIAKLLTIFEEGGVDMLWTINGD